MKMDEWNIKKAVSTLSSDEAEEIETKFLIYIVKCSPFIYDASYTKNDECKLIFWERVAKVMGMSSGHKAAEKWDKLKYEFTLNAKRQKMIKQGILNNPNEPWKYMIEMKFLLPFVGGMTEDDLIDKEEALEDNDIERLITEIKNYPSLYDPTHSDYKNFLVRDYNWILIANKFSKYSIANVKETWKNINNNYLRIIKRNMSNVCGLLTGPMLRYKYEEQLEFILPILKARNFTDDDVDNERCPYFENDETVASPICEQMEQKVEVEGVTQAGSIPNEQNVPTESEGSQQPDNSMYHFFMSIYNSTNELPAALQLEMKKKIFNAVTSAEEIWWTSTSAQSSKQS